MMFSVPIILYTVARCMFASAHFRYLPLAWLLILVFLYQETTPTNSLHASAWEFIPVLIFKLIALPALKKREILHLFQFPAIGY